MPVIPTDASKKIFAPGRELVPSASCVHFYVQLINTPKLKCPDNVREVCVYHFLPYVSRMQMCKMCMFKTEFIEDVTD